ncbi:hypothetical protein NLJ89_g9811 [Agrocybe chaxingu]|uniref:S-adenosyl-L-methionine-dependent methyltransferase n=1 Tax=Agrocybe chaxingu TaxID=84603 RepID=A0A9W8JV81_9AGAR|nr:hypothetical protein NLJ89_g9811 [Agrocybe chaxingu]
MNDSTLLLGITFLCILLGFTMWSRARFQDPYGLFHLTLNKSPSGDPDAPPSTEWLNMGYWKVSAAGSYLQKVFDLRIQDARNLPEASLALKLTTAAHLKEGGSVLDVGHGTGESLLLLLSELSLPRPSRLAGITSLAVHHQRSLERVQKLQSTCQAPTKVDLHHGDAVYDGSTVNHPLSPSAAGAFDSILALDCAYHLHTRRRFLEQSFAKLAPRGTIALADVCFSSAALVTRWTKIVTSVLRMMPPSNLISDEEYVAQMKEIGFIDVTLEDITPDVFPGFIAFLKGRGWGWWIFGMVMQCYAGAGAKFVIVSGRKS